MTTLQNPPYQQDRSQRAAAADDPVTAFVRSHQAALLRFVRLCGAGSSAEEVAQEALLIALRRGLDTAATARAAAFLRQTAKHLWLRQSRDDQRRAARHAEIAEHLWRQHLAPDDGDGWLHALRECLAALPRRARLALDRTYRDGLGRAELGAELGIGEHGVRSLLQRLRATLRTCIEQRRTR